MSARLRLISGLLAGRTGRSSETKADRQPGPEQKQEPRLWNAYIRSALLFDPPFLESGVGGSVGSHPLLHTELRVEIDEGAVGVAGKRAIRDVRHHVAGTAAMVEAVVQLDPVVWRHTCVEIVDGRQAPQRVVGWIVVVDVAR